MPRRASSVTPASRGLKIKYVTSCMYAFVCVCYTYVDAPQGFNGDSRLMGVKKKILASCTYVGVRMSYICTMPRRALLVTPVYRGLK